MVDIRHARLIAESRKCLSWTSDAPFLRLRGHWLAQAGFTIGLDVEVTVEPGRLIITPCAQRGQPARGIYRLLRRNT